jgi:hypothetical protein
MEKNSQVVVATEKTLQLYLYHRNPWEYYTVCANNPAVPFIPPSEKALQRVVRFALHKEAPRKAGFSVGRKSDRSRAIGLKYAQCKLYVDHGVIAASAEDLLCQYERHYGAWPYARAATRDVYFLQDYQVICQTIAEISQHEAFRTSVP